MRAKHRKPTILLALTSTHHGFYHGAARYAAEHDWHIVADMIYDATIPFGWKGDGILFFCRSLGRTRSLRRFRPNPRRRDFIRPKRSRAALRHGRQRRHRPARRRTFIRT